MMFKVEDVKKFKVADEGLLEFLKAVLVGKEDLEDVTFEFDSVSYGFNEVHQDDEIDEGKYTNGCYYYQLVSFDETIESYPCQRSEIDALNVLVYVSYTKSGSYYSDYQWYYDEPVINIIDVRTVPKVVIPEHEEVYFRR